MSATILLIRHGETAWNRGKIFRGKHDVELNENGRKQAGLAAGALRGRTIEAAYTSPLSRAAETAEISLAGHGLEVRPREGLLDMDYGDWTGIPDSEVATRWPAEHAEWTATPHLARIPGGETLQEVSARALAALEEIATNHDGQTVALYAHRVVNKLLVMACLELGLERFPFIMQGNCSINELERTPAGYVVHAINDTAHMRNADADLLTADF